MNYEMSKQSVMQNYTPTNRLLAAISSGTIDEYIKKHGPYVAPETLQINEIMNLKSFVISDVAAVEF